MPMPDTKVQSRRPTNRVRLSVESLETRLTPASFTTYSWRPAANSDLLWGTAANWYVKDVTGAWEQASTYPGESGIPYSPDVEFDNNSGNRDCIANVDGCKVANLRVKSTYSSTIKFDKAMAVYNNFALESAGAVLTGWSLATNQAAQSAITVGTSLSETDLALIGLSNPSFTWSAGSIRSLTVNAAATQSGGARTKVLITPNNGQTRSMWAASLNVGGDLSWSDGNVAVVATTAGPSAVNITESGTATINSTGTWGLARDSSKFTWTNAGATTVEASGVVTIAGNYFNSGATTIKRGTLKITGKAESSAGTIGLRDRASVDATYAVDNSLYILGGSLNGDGTVMGNLSLGRENAAGWVGGGVAPGFLNEQGQRVVGTINVTDNFKMWSSACSVTLSVNATGGVSKLEVVGNVALTGSVSVDWHSSYNPAVGTSVTFMSYGGQRTGQFTSASFSFGSWQPGGPSTPSASPTLFLPGDANMNDTWEAVVALVELEG